jgi:hypothetical protein
MHPGGILSQLHPVISTSLPAAAGIGYILVVGAWVVALAGAS